MKPSEHDTPAMRLLAGAIPRDGAGTVHTTVAIVALQSARREIGALNHACSRLERELEKERAVTRRPTHLPTSQRVWGVYRVNQGGEHLDCLVADEGAAHQLAVRLGSENEAEAFVVREWRVSK